MCFIWFSSLVFVLVYSQTWSESGANDGIIYYQSSDSYVRNGWAYDWSIFCVDYFTFKSTCCSANDMIILIDRDDDWQKIFQFDSGSDSMTMNSLTIINTNNGMQHCLDTENMKNGLNFYLGCFESTYYSYDGTDYTCRTYLDDSKYTTVEIYSSSFTLFGDSVDQVFTMRYHEITSDQFYIFVGGVGSQTIDFDFQPSMSDSYLTNGVYYLFTTDQNANLDTQDTPSGYEIINICSRKDIFNRYGMVKDSTTITDCSCTLNDEQTTISSSTSFNYPDCNYNSSALDLTLPSTSSTYSLSNDLLEWYSITFTTSSQSIEINDGQTLTIDELNINQESISFNENVNVTNLTITTIGSSFNILNFENIVIPTVNDNDIIFTIESTDTDLSIFGLEQKDGEVKIGICFYNGNNYVNRLYNNYAECSLLKNNENNNLNLQINSSFYTISVSEYWKNLKLFDSDVTISGTSQLKATVCEFENKTITIDGDLYCTTMNIDSNTKVIVNGELTIDTLVITDDINDNLNENGIIESYGSISITTISITTQSNCIELISSNSTITQPSINSDYSTLLLSQNHLLRICPSSTNYEVTCTTIANTFEQQSFDLLHCPCIDSNCTINVTTTQLDTTNVEFDGTFNILTNSSIAISYKTTSFSINLKNDKQILLIGNGAVGFETSLNTNSLKSETTTLTIESSNQIYCKAIILQYDNQQCIITDSTTYPSVGDIDNCQLQNGYGCEICYEGYESNVTNCNACPSNCLRCYNGYCINCEMNYYVDGSGGCSTINEPIISYENEKAMKCNDGYYSNGNECIQCSDSNCVSCNSSTCLTCNIGYQLNNGNCQIKEESNGEEVLSNYGVIECIVGYYSNNSQCIDCSSTFDNCEICNINECLICNEKYLSLNDGSCSLNTNCLNIGDSICLSCDDKGSWFNGNECEKCGDNCKNCINGYCIECNDGYILQSENNCVDTNQYPDNCITLSYYGTCQRCSDGYYLNNNFCYSCPEHCTTCHNSTYCFECNDGYMLNSNNECVDINSILSNCQQPIPGSSGGCAICNEGYYRNQSTCLSCISNCTKCNNGESCLICESDYFLLNDASECISYDELTDCETTTQSGCTKCINSSYYLNNQYCTSCSDTIDNCNTCSSNGECTTCQNEYVLVDSKCINYQLIDSCTEVSDSKCISCSFWHTPNSDQTGCDTQIVWWVIALFILILFIVIIVIIAIIFYVTILYLNYRKIEKQRKLYTIFDMNKSNIKFVSTENEDVVINKNEILFNDECEEIGVNEETRDLICVGNTSNHTIKVQFSIKEGCDKYEIRTNPQLITIPKGKALEFEIFIKPLCTCKINDQIMLISANLSKGKTITTSITINTQTVMTSHLDYDELEENIKLGEGGFGIVYKGTFRGNQVAIKVMKGVNGDEEQMEEFNREVAMLDKFRSNYIVHFYGAVMIPNKMCMVTELAQYGSVLDLRRKSKKKCISSAMQLKIFKDSAKGIQYLHSNGILHRDIKPDNILVVSLDPTVEINAKLTDFGSSRNINMLMTNMTFTKGIGTPVYMAPEVLNRERYEKHADVYSFGVTMFEIDIWRDIYPISDDRFKFPWSIAEFVTHGNRLPKPEEMEQEIYDIIDKSWKHDVKERIDINTVLGVLNSMC